MMVARMDVVHLFFVASMVQLILISALRGPLFNILDLGGIPNIDKQTNLLLV